MNYRALLGDAAIAVAAQGSSLAISVVTSLIVPKILGVEGFGYWQLFLLYGSFAGFSLLGLNDGVYLILGGRHRSELDTRAIGSQFWFGMLLQIPPSIVLLVIALFGEVGAERSFVVLATIAYMILFNASGFLGYLFQAVGETRLFSFSILVGRLAFSVPVVVLIVCRSTDFRGYVVAQVFSQLATLLYCIWFARDLLSGRLLPFARTLRISFTSMRVGVKLMLANIASLLILGVMRFFIDARWGIEAFSKLSFALSLVTFYLGFISQLSMVFFPALRRATGKELRSIFLSMRSLLATFLPAVYLFYYPAKILLSAWLPQYAESLDYLIYLLPLCVFDGQMKLLSFTYFKALRSETALMWTNLIAVGLSSMLSYLGVWTLGSVEFTICAVVVVVAARSLLAEASIAQRLGLPRSLSGVSELLLTVAFVLLNLSIPSLPAFVVYLVAYFGFLFLSRGRVLEHLLRMRSDG